MTKQKESFSFEVPPDLPEPLMIDVGVTSLEVYDTVYNVTQQQT